MHYLQGTEGAYFRADTAARAVLLNGKVGVDQFEGTFRTDGDAATAISTNIPMYFEH